MPLETISDKNVEQAWTAQVNKARALASKLVKQFVETNPPPATDTDAWTAQLTSYVLSAIKKGFGGIEDTLTRGRHLFGEGKTPYRDLQDFVSKEIAVNLQNQLIQVKDTGTKAPPSQGETGEVTQDRYDTEKPMAPRGPEGSTPQEGEESKEAAQIKRGLITASARILLGAYTAYYTTSVSRIMFRLLYAHKDSFFKSMTDAAFGRRLPEEKETLDNNFGWGEDFPEFIAVALGPLSEFMAQPGTLQDKALGAAKNPNIVDSPELVMEYGPAALEQAFEYAKPRIAAGLRSYQGMDLNVTLLSVLASLGGVSPVIDDRDLYKIAEKKLEESRGEANYTQRVEREVNRLRDAYMSSFPTLSLPPTTQLLFKVAYDHYKSSGVSKAASGFKTHEYLIGMRLLGQLGRQHGQNGRHRVQTISKGHHSGPQGRAIPSGPRAGKDGSGYGGSGVHRPAKEG